MTPLCWVCAYHCTYFLKLGIGLIVLVFHCFVCGGRVLTSCTTGFIVAYSNFQGICLPCSAVITFITRLDALSTKLPVVLDCKYSSVFTKFLIHLETKLGHAVCNKQAHVTKTTAMRFNDCNEWTQMTQLIVKSSGAVFCGRQKSMQTPHNVPFSQARTFIWDV